MPSFRDASCTAVGLKLGSIMLWNVNHCSELIRSTWWFIVVDIPYWPLRLTTGFSPTWPFLVVM